MAHIHTYIHVSLLNIAEVASDISQSSLAPEQPILHDHYSQNMAPNQAKDAQNLYAGRASSYDASFHERFSSNVVQILNLKPGEKVLDLACGTGLVTFKASNAVGPSGSVVGVDISTDMLAEARTKLEKHTLSNVQLCQHSITELESLAQLHNRKFDAITCASALVLLPGPGAALEQWTKYLKPGGRLITDVTHSRALLPGIALERVGRALQLPIPWYREAFQQPKDLEDLMRNAGLLNIEIRRVSQLNSRDGSDNLHAFIADAQQRPLTAKTYTVSDAVDVFDAHINKPYGACMRDEPISSQAKHLFVKEWSRLADQNGMLWEVDEVFVGLGWTGL